MKVIQNIIEQHAEEAAFLWLLRDAAVRAPHYHLKDLAKLDDRIEAHIDGLRIAGDAGWALCKQALALEEAGEVFAASVLAFESGDNERTRIAVTAGCLSPSTWRGLISALGWLPYSQIEIWVQRLLVASLPLYRRIAIAACAVHRRDPGPVLAAAVEDPDPMLQACALRAAGELKRRDLLPALRQYLKSTDENCRFWAAWSTVLLNDPSGIVPLQRFVEDDSPFQQRSLQLGTARYGYRHRCRLAQGFAAESRIGPCGGNGRRHSRQSGGDSLADRADGEPRIGSRSR